MIVMRIMINKDENGDDDKGKNGSDNDVSDAMIIVMTIMVMMHEYDDYGQSVVDEDDHCISQESMMLPYYVC